MKWSDPAPWFVWLMLFFFLGLLTVGILFIIYMNQPGLKLQIMVPAVSASTRWAQFQQQHRTYARLLGGADHDVVAHPSLTIKSLKYAFTHIMLAEKADLEGTGFNNPQGVLQAVLQEANDVDYKTGTTSETTKWFDVMDRTTLNAALNSTVIKQGFLEAYQPKTQKDANGNTYEAPADTTGTFNFLSVNYLRPIKLNAEMKFPGTDHKLITLPGENKQRGTDAQGFDQFSTYVPAGSGGSLWRPDVNTETSQEATMIMGNGGTWMQLAQPIFYDQAVAQEATLTLIYDPYVLMRATHATGEDQTGEEILASTTNKYAPPLFDAAGNAWEVPIMSNIPVLLPKGATIQREMYRIAMPQTASLRREVYDIIVVLYYTSDASTYLKGASITLVMGAEETTFPEAIQYMTPQPMKLAVDTSSETNKWSLLDYAGRPIVSRLKRVSGGTTTMRLHQNYIEPDSTSWGFTLSAAENTTAAYEDVTALQFVTDTLE